MQDTSTAPTVDTTYRVWVSTFGLYNAGALVGYWIDAADAPTTIEEFVSGLAERGMSLSAALALEVGEELHCFDVENAPHGHAGEVSPGEARAIAEVLAMVEDHERAAFDQYLENVHSGGLDADTVDRFRDEYRGEYEASDELDAIAESLAELYSESELPEWARPHYWGMMRDIARDGGMNAYRTGAYGERHALWAVFS